MKKYFYTILAAVAIVASCAKEADNGTSQTLDKASSLFSGTIIQPNGLTKVSIIDQKEDDHKVCIQWNSGDKIWVKKNSGSEGSWGDDTSLRALTASQDGVTVNFVGVTDGWADAPDYSARFYGKNDAWRSYVLSQHSEYNPCDLDLKNVSDGDSPVLLENMPLYCEKSGKKDDNINYFVFSSEHAILQINVPKKLDFDDLFICASDNSTDNPDVKFENGRLTDDSNYIFRLINASSLKNVSKFADKNYVTYFVPVEGDKSYYKLAIVAAKGTLGDDMHEVARMSTYEYNGKNSNGRASISLGVNTIYFFDFCNTLTIEGGESPIYEYNLTSYNNIDYKVNIAQDYGVGKKLTINAIDEATAPANIFINARNCNVADLVINTPYSHVEIDYGQSVNVTSKTSLNTFVVKEHYAINELTVSKGSVVVEGKEDNTANVSTVTIPEGVTEQIIIDVTGVSAEENDRVEIVNNSAPGNVYVVIEKDDNPDGGESKEYYITQNEVTTVEKDIVATIGKAGYETLAEAVEAVKSNETIVLVKDVELSDPIVTDKTFTLTLNANISPVSTWEGGGYKDGIIIIKRGGNLTINGSGKILNNGVEKAYAAVKMTQKDEPDGAAAKLTVGGTVTIEGYYYGICGNGQRHDTEITINGGTIKGTAQNDNVGIFHPQSGTLTINGGTIEGSTGIALKGGKLVVNGGKIVGNGEKQDFLHNGSGWYNTGDALAVEVCDYPGQNPPQNDLSVEIKGGEFSSVNAEAEAVASYAQPDKDYTPLTGFISGGTFSSDPWKYCAKGYASVLGENGMWKIVDAPKADVVRVHPDPDLSQEIPETILETLESNLFYKSESQTPAGIPIPSVKEDGRMVLADGYNSVFDLANGLTLKTVGNLNGLDVCYIFAAMNGQDAKSDGTKGEFDDYYADFVVSLDRDVNANDIGLWGFYASWGVAMAFPAPELISAGTEVELLGLLGKDGHSTFTYNDIKEQVKVFPCGAFKLSNNIKNATMKVDLRIYDNTDPNHEKYFVIESYEYTFTNETNAVISKEVNSQTELNDAIANAKAGDGISIATAGEYKLPKLPYNITISGVNGVMFDCDGSGNIAEIPNGATFQNVTLNMGQSEYHGFHHAGYIQFKNCKINGYYKTYGNTKFENCVFNQDTYAYCLNAYGDDLDVINCTFNNKGKAFYCYNEGNPAHYTVNFTGCTFNVEYGTKAKSQIFVKNNVAGQKYTVNISDCKIGTSNKTVEEFKTLDIDPDLTNGKGDFRLWNIEEGGAKGKYVKVTLNGETVYSYGSLE